MLILLGVLIVFTVSCTSFSSQIAVTYR